MKEKIKLQKGFIQIPILIAIIAGVLIISGGSYFGIKQYHNYQAEKIEKEKQSQVLAGVQQKALEEATSEIEKLKQEAEQVNQKQTALEQELKQTVEQANQKQTSRTEPPTTTTELPKKTDLQAIVKYWHPVVVYVLCEFDYSNGVILYQSGSGTLSKTGHTISGNMAIKVITNNHVLSDENNNGPNKCSVVVPFDQTYIMVNDGTSEITGRDDVDLGGIVINDPSKYLQNLPLLQNVGINACGSVPELGSLVAILGYPAIGSQTDITITQGIISAYDGNYYVTDAKMDHGNSGGAAIDINNNCYLGIPTAAVSGTIESLGRILKWQSTI